MASAFTDAYVRYFTKFPDKASLGEGATPAVWKAELDAVSGAAFDPILMTAGTLEGGNVGGSRNFESMHLVRALYAIRALRDPDFVNPYDNVPLEPPVRMGAVVRMNGY